MRTLGIDPVHGTRHTFDGLLSAMSRPGSIHTVPAPADHAVIATLVDHEVTVATSDETLRKALSEHGRLNPESADNASVVHLLDHSTVNLQDCKRGSLTEPSDSATVVYRLSMVSAESPDGTTVMLSGPGVDRTRSLSVSLPKDELAELAAVQSDYPRGVDAIFTTETRLAAIPRSASLEVA